MAFCGQAFCAPHEINVFADELEAPGKAGLEMHVNYARGRESRAYDAEIPPHKVWRVMPEFVIGLRPNWEAGLHLPLQRDRDGKFHADGVRVRLKGMLPQEEPARFFAGVNFEVGYDKPHLSEDRHNFELRGIAGWRGERWLVAINPILAWVLKGANKSGKAEFESGIKIMRDAGTGWAFGFEHYGSYGRLGNFAPRHKQDRMLYFVAEREGKSFNLNVGVGARLTPASDRRVIKAVIGIPFH